MLYLCSYRIQLWIFVLQCSWLVPGHFCNDVNTTDHHHATNTRDDHPCADAFQDGARSSRSNYLCHSMLASSDREYFYQIPAPPASVHSHGRNSGNNTSLQRLNAKSLLTTISAVDISSKTSSDLGGHNARTDNSIGSLLAGNHVGPIDVYQIVQPRTGNKVKMENAIAPLWPERHVGAINAVRPEDRAIFRFPITGQNKKNVFLKKSQQLNHLYRYPQPIRVIGPANRAIPNHENVKTLWAPSKSYHRALTSRRKSQAKNIDGLTNENLQKDHITISPNGPLQMTKVRTSNVKFPKGTDVGSQNKPERTEYLIGSRDNQLKTNILAVSPDGTTKTSHLVIPPDRQSPHDLFLESQNVQVKNNNFAGSSDGHSKVSHFVEPPSGKSLLVTSVRSQNEQLKTSHLDESQDGLMKISHHLEPPDVLTKTNLLMGPLDGQPLLYPFDKSQKSLAKAKHHLGSPDGLTETKILSGSPDVLTKTNLHMGPLDRQPILYPFVRSKNRMAKTKHHLGSPDLLTESKILLGSEDVLTMSSLLVGPLDRHYLLYPSVVSQKGRTKHLLEPSDGLSKTKHLSGSPDGLTKARHLVDHLDDQSIFDPFLEPPNWQHGSKYPNWHQIFDFQNLGVPINLIPGSRNWQPLFPKFSPAFPPDLQILPKGQQHPMAEAKSQWGKALQAQFPHLANHLWQRYGFTLKQDNPANSASKKSSIDRWTTQESVPVHADHNTSYGDNVTKSEKNWNAITSVTSLDKTEMTVMAFPFPVGENWGPRLGGEAHWPLRNGSMKKEHDSSSTIGNQSTVENGTTIWMNEGTGYFAKGGEDGTTGSEQYNGCFTSWKFIRSLEWIAFSHDDSKTIMMIAMALTLFLLVFCATICIVRIYHRDKNSCHCINLDTNRRLADIQMAVFHLSSDNREKLSKLMYDKIMEVGLTHLSRYFDGIGHKNSKRMNFNLLFDDLAPTFNLHHVPEVANRSMNTTPAQNIDLNDGLQQFLYGKEGLP